MYQHELIFEVKEQAELVASQLTDVERIRISDISDEVLLFDAESAFELQFRTVYPLDLSAQLALAQCDGLIPEVSLGFNTNTEKEDLFVTGSRCISCNNYLCACDE